MALFYPAMITPGHIHFSVRAADPALKGQELLSASEHARLAGMHEGARPAFVTARAMLRRRLAAYMGVTAQAVPLVQEGAGRIEIDGFDAGEPPFFSVSHTGSADESIAAVAVTDGAPIGIDIQEIDPEFDWQRLAARRFNAADQALLAQVPEDVACPLFFTLWSIKEAFVKLEDGTLMPYLRNIALHFRDGAFTLAAPTPKGLTSPKIVIHTVPEHRMVLACVCPQDIPLTLDIDIQKPSRRPDPLLNRPIEGI